MVREHKEKREKNEIEKCALRRLVTQERRKRERPETTEHTKKKEGKASLSFRIVFSGLKYMNALSHKT